MFCTKCGNEMPDGSKFCTKCGAAFGGGAASEAPTGAAALSSGARLSPRKVKMVAVIAAAAVAVAGVSFAIWAVFFAPYDIDESRFPDPVLRQAILDQVDPDGDGKVARDEAAAVESLSVDGASNVAGLGIFPNLKALALSGEALRSVDVADRTALESLSAEGCVQLAEVILGEKPALRVFLAPNAEIANIDLSRAPALETLDLEGSPLPELALGACTGLASLNVRGTALTALDLSDNGVLSELLVDDAVRLDNLDATPLHEHWAVSSFTRAVPDLGDIEGYEVRAEGEFDDAGRLIALSTYPYDQEERYEYSYDEAGRLVAMDDSGTNGSPAVHWDVSYDEAGRLSQASSDMGDRYTVRYGANGLPETCRVVVGQGGASTLVFSYDTDGRLASWSHRYEGGNDSVLVVAYGDDGRISSVSSPDADSFEAKAYGVERNGDGEPVRVSYRWGHYGSYAQTMSYTDSGTLSDAVREVEANTGVMHWSFPTVSSTSFEYDDRGRLVKWQPQYGDTASDGAAKSGECTLSYKRFVTLEEDYDAPRFAQIDNILSACLDPYFWNPFRAFAEDRADSQLIYGGVPAAFEVADGGATAAAGETSAKGQSGASPEAERGSSEGGQADEAETQPEAAVPEEAVEPVAFKGITSAEASSALPVDEVNTSGYDASNVLDGDLKSAWVEGVSGSGLNEWISLSGGGEQGFSGFTIWSGYQKSDRHYEMNARPSRVGVYVDGELVGRFDLEDAGLTSQRIDFGSTYPGSELRIAVESAYPGSKYEDCAISEIEVF